MGTATGCAVNGKDKVETRLYNRPRELFIPARPAPQTPEKIESGAEMTWPRKVLTDNI
jgi:hypothetical protein